MKLYHYTTIDTLALILANKTIRFTRLDQLDDYQEVGIYATDITKSVFVSCWTHLEEESVAQWSIYGGNKRGILISLDSSFIDFPNPYFEIEYEGESYFVLKDLISNNEPVPITYLTSEELKNQANQKVVVTEFNGVNVYGQLGNLKSKHWEFQNEYRLFVSVIKHPKHIFKDLLAEEMLTLHQPKMKYVDLSLSNGFEGDIEIYLGPLCSCSDKIILESLMNTSSIAKPLRESQLKGILRK